MIKNNLPPTEPPQPATNPRRFCWRRLVQYRLRSLLILTTVIAVWLGWWTSAARRQREAVAAIKEAHGRVFYDFEDFEQPPWWSETLGKKLGVDYFAKVQEVSFISCRDRGSAPLEHVKGLSGLKMLVLCNTTVTDANLEHLTGQASLEKLGIDDARVTDAGVEHLCKLKGLKFLGLNRTQITDAGVKRLQKTLPNCKIDRHWRLFGSSDL